MEQSNNEYYKGVGGYPGAGSHLPGSTYPPMDISPAGFPNHGDFPQPMTTQPPPGYGYPPPGQLPVANAMHGSFAPRGPAGLQYLSMLDQLIVRQKIEPLEEIIGIEMSNKYVVQNNMGQNIYVASEISDCCTRTCGGPLRAFDMKIEDHVGNEIIHLNRPCACACCLCPCCLQTMEVSAPPGVLIGTIKQEWTVCTPKFIIEDAVGEIALRIEGPICTCSMCGDIEFQILSTDGITSVGKITKQWAGILQEMFTDADNFGITFSMELDVNMKAVMLGACFLIDFIFFENSPNQKQHHHN